jgi:hypothetical protein
VRQNREEPVQFADGACSLRHREQSHASSFAGEFTVQQGNRYRAILALGSVERLADKAAIAQKFRALGFVSVCVSGSGARRRVEGVWPGKKTNANLPQQIVAVAKL